jgi:hypothetical protein
MYFSTNLNSILTDLSSPLWDISSLGQTSPSITSLTDTVGSDGTVRLGDEPGRTARTRASGRRAWLTGGPKMFSNF